MERIFILGAALVALNFNCLINAQNLLLNGSFEKIVPHHGDLATYIDTFYASHWYRAPNKASPDFYGNTDDTTVVDIRLERWRDKYVADSNGFHVEPSDGLYCPGIILFSVAGYTEYLIGKLSEPLVAGVQYNIGFDIKPGLPHPQVIPNGIGFKFLVTPKLSYPSTYNRKPFNPLEDIFAGYPSRADCLIDTFLSDTAWHRYSLKYTAKGGEKFLAVGRFYRGESQRFAKRMLKNRMFPLEKRIKRYARRGDTKTFLFPRRMTDLTRAIAEGYYVIDNIAVVSSSSRSRQPNAIRMEPSPPQPPQVPVVDSIYVDAGFVGKLSLNLGACLDRQTWFHVGTKSGHYYIIPTSDIDANCFQYRWSVKARKVRNDYVTYGPQYYNEDRMAKLRRQSTRSTTLMLQGKEYLRFDSKKAIE